MDVIYFTSQLLKTLVHAENAWNVKLQPSLICQEVFGWLVVAILACSFGTPDWTRRVGSVFTISWLQSQSAGSLRPLYNDLLPGNWLSTSLTAGDATSTDLCYFYSFSVSCCWSLCLFLSSVLLFDCYKTVWAVILMSCWLLWQPVAVSIYCLRYIVFFIARWQINMIDWPTDWLIDWLIDWPAESHWKQLCSLNGALSKSCAIPLVNARFLLCVHAVQVNPLTPNVAGPHGYSRYRASYARPG